MNKKIALFISILAIVLTVSAISATASAATSTSINGKGAVATWHIQNVGSSNPVTYTDVYAILSESNSGTDGNLYLMVHGTTIATTPVDFTWNMDHITVSAMVTIWGITHTIDITWQSLPKSQGIAPGSSNGMTVNLGGSWKAAVATITFDGTHPGSSGPFDSMSAYIVHGSASIALP